MERQKRHAGKRKRASNRGRVGERERKGIGIDREKQQSEADGRSRIVAASDEGQRAHGERQKQNCADAVAKRSDEERVERAHGIARLRERRTAEHASQKRRRHASDLTHRDIIGSRWRQRQQHLQAVLGLKL
jgi:hypothetical protein